MNAVEGTIGTKLRMDGQTERRVCTRMGELRVRISGDTLITFVFSSIVTVLEFVQTRYASVH